MDPEYQDHRVIDLYPVQSEEGGEVWVRGPRSPGTHWSVTIQLREPEAYHLEGWLTRIGEVEEAQAQVGPQGPGGPPENE